MAALVREREAGLTKIDPNVEATDLMQFRLPGLEGAEPVSLASLKGKTVVLDFWATWCAPCRIQRPMIEDVRKRYEDKPDVVFLAIDADDNPDVVKDFLKDTGWQGTFYFEGGLAHYLTVAQLPTIIVLDPGGRIYSRMSGFIPERFEAMLTERIDEARSAGATEVTLSRRKWLMGTAAALVKPLEAAANATGGRRQSRSACRNPEP